MEESKLLEMELDEVELIPELNSEEEADLLATTEMVLSSSPLDLTVNKSDRTENSVFRIPRKAGISSSNDLLGEILSNAPPKYQSPLANLEIQSVIPKITYQASATPIDSNSFQLNIPELRSLAPNPMRFPDNVSLFTGEPFVAPVYPPNIQEKRKYAPVMAKGRGARKTWGPHDSISKLIHAQIRAQVRKQIRGKPRVIPKPNPIENAQNPVYYHLEKILRELRNQSNRGPRGARGAYRGHRY